MVCLKQIQGEIAVGTPVGSRLSKQQAVNMLVEIIEKATADDISLDEKQAGLHWENIFWSWLRGTHASSKHK